MKITASALDRLDRRDYRLIRATARARRGAPRSLKTPEYRALDEIVADARAHGNAPVVVGPAGILEIRSPSNDFRWRTATARVTEVILHRRCRVEVGPEFD